MILLIFPVIACAEVQAGTLTEAHRRTAVDWILDAVQDIFCFNTEVAFLGVNYMDRYGGFGAALLFVCLAGLLVREMKWPNNEGGGVRALLALPF